MIKQEGIPTVCRSQCSIRVWLGEYGVLYIGGPFVHANFESSFSRERTQEGEVIFLIGCVCIMNRYLAENKMYNN